MAVEQVLWQKMSWEAQKDVWFRETVGGYMSYDDLTVMTAY